MADFHFIRPQWFFALIPLIWMLWQLNRQKLGGHGWQQIIPSHLVEHLMQGKNATQHKPFWLLAVIWFIVVTALAGPAWEKLPQPVYQTNTGKVLVMDMSQSMMATDLTPNRLTKARFKAIDLIDKIDDADMGLIAYSGDAFVISPLTADSKNLTALIPSLSPNIMPLIGSNAYAALDLADSLLKNAGYTKGEIYWITDGIDQAELKDIRELLSRTNHRVSVLGVGTTEGAPIKQTNGELLKDGRGSIIIPKLNDSYLRAVARATDGAYVRVTSTAVDIETLAQQELISREAKKEQDEQLHQGDQFREFGPIMVMLILPFAAYAFRRGLVFAMLLTSSLMLTTPAPVLAADEQAAASKEPEPAPASQGSTTPSWWTNMWQTQDQQGAEHYSQENYADAAQTFDNSQWKGSSLYKSGDYEGALKEFQQSNDATGLYNQGNAHAKMQNFDEAIKAYEKALEQNPDMEDAQKNLDLIKQMQEQQQQQQNQDGENQEQQDQQNQDQQNQDQQNQQGQQDQSGSESEQQQGESEQQEGQQQEQEQQGQQGEKSDTQPREQEQQQGDQDPQAQQQEEAEEQSVPGEEKEGEEGQEGEQQLKPTDAQSTEEKEQMQEIQQLIRKINDDPAVLLRNKMQLEYQKRKYQNSSPPGAKSW